MALNSNDLKDELLQQLFGGDATSDQEDAIGKLAIAIENHIKRGEITLTQSDVTTASQGSNVTKNIR